MKITVVQPPYFIGDEPDKKIMNFCIKKMESAEKDSLIVLPEYSNAGGISDSKKQIEAAKNARIMLDNASSIAKQKSAYIALNVLETRDGKLRNSTYLFDQDGKTAFVYDKIHLPPSEMNMEIQRGNGSCFREINGIRFGFLTCYDIYFSEQIECLARHKPDIIIFPVYQRGERTDIIKSQTKLLAFRCNSFVARSSYSMGNDKYGGCSMIVSPDGEILKDFGNETGDISVKVDHKWKFMRTAGFGGDTIRNDDFINNGLCPVVFNK